MNRREALKKLAAGVAVAVGASAVLTSNGVAFAASPGDTGVVGFPPQGEQFPFGVVVGGPGNSTQSVTVTLNPPSSIVCSPGALTILYGWRLNSRSSNDIVLTLPSGPVINSIGSSYTAPNQQDSSVTVSRGGSLNGQTYSFGLITEAFCGAGQPVLRTEYEFNGDGGSVTQVPGDQSVVH